jgi:hypothetical protein
MPSLMVVAPQIIRSLVWNERCHRRDVPLLLKEYAPGAAFDNACEA